MALYTLGSSGAEPLAGKEFYHLTGFGIVLFQIAHALGKAFVIGRLKKNPEYSNIFGPLLSAPPRVQVFQNILGVLRRTGTETILPISACVLVIDTLTSWADLLHQILASSVFSASSCL